MLIIMVFEIPQQVPDRVSRTLVPTLTFVGLLGRQYIHKPFAKQAEIIRVFDVRVERRRVVLGEHINTIVPRIEAIGNRDIYQSVLAGNRHCWLRTFFGQWIQPCTLASPQYYGDYTVLNHNLFGYVLIKIYI